MKNRNIVKQDYRLVNARYKLNTSETKFIMATLAQINMDDTAFKTYEIKVSELEKQLQAEQNETRLRQFAKQLMSKPVEVPTDTGWIVFNWFSKIQYVRGESKFIVRIDGDLKPYLLELKERFVKFNLQYILPLSSNYSIRIYQLLKEYENLTRRTFTVDELQDLLQVPKSYKLYSKFKQGILQVAERELIDHCDIFFEYEEVKKGKKVNELHFRIKPNRSKNPEPSLFDLEPSKYEKYKYKKLLTKDGQKEINFIEDLGDTLKIYFVDGTHALIANEETLQKALKA